MRSANGREWCRSSFKRVPERRAGFTLVELLVSLAVIAVLISVLLPALGRGMARAKAFRCQNNLRSIAFDFAFFADTQMGPPRGTDTERYGPNRFSLETFIESEYRIDEFWPRAQDEVLVSRSTDPAQDQMRCASVEGVVQMRRNTPCRAGALSPAQNVSFGFNSRLYRVELIDQANRPISREVQLTQDILATGSVPLVWDIDGSGAASEGVVPHFSAPALDSRGPYRNDRFWWPGNRHEGAAHFALIDGSVHSTSTPLAEAGWRWAYQPRP